MSDPGTFVILDEEGIHHYSNRHAQLGIHAILADGPAAAIADIANNDEPRVRANALGGALIDTTRQHLLVFGVDWDTDSYIEDRRAYLEFLKEMWPGWRGEWADHGLHSFDAYTQSDIPHGDSLDWETADFRIIAGAVDERALDEVWHLITVRQATGTVLAVAAECLEHPVAGGPRLIEHVQDRGSRILAAPTLPMAGVHVELQTHHLGYWSSGVCIAIPFPPEEIASAAWPGWTCDFWEDRYEEQLHRCGDVVDLPKLDLAAGFNRIEEALITGRYPSFPSRQDDPDYNPAARERVAAGLARARERVVGAL